MVLLVLSTHLQMPKRKLKKNFTLQKVRMLQRGKGNRYRTKEVLLSEVFQHATDNTVNNEVSLILLILEM